MPNYSINIDTPGLGQARAGFEAFRLAVQATSFSLARQIAQNEELRRRMAAMLLVMGRMAQQVRAGVVPALLTMGTAARNATAGLLAGTPLAAGFAAALSSVGNASALAARWMPRLTRVGGRLSAVMLGLDDIMIGMLRRFQALPLSLRVASIAFAVAAVAVNRWLAALERTGQANRQLLESASDLGLTAVEYQRLEAAAAAAGVSVLSLADGTVQLNEAQRAAIRESEALTLVMDEDLVQATARLSVARERLSNNLRILRQDFLGLGTAVSDFGTGIANFGSRFVIALNAVLTNLREAALQPLAVSLSELSSALTQAGLESEAFDRIMARVAASANEAGNAISANAGQAVIDLQEQVRTLQRAIAEQLGGVGNAQVQQQQVILETTQRRAALLDRIVTAGLSEANAQSDVVALLEQANRQVSQYETGQRNIAQLMRAQQVEVQDLEAALQRAGGAGSALGAELQDRLQAARRILEGYASAGQVSNEVLQRQVTIVQLLQEELARISEQQGPPLSDYQEFFQEITDSAAGNVQQLQFFQEAVGDLQRQLDATDPGTQRFRELTLALAIAERRLEQTRTAIQDMLIPQEELNEQTQAFNDIWTTINQRVDDANNSITAMNEISASLARQFQEIYANGIVSPEEEAKLERLREVAEQLGLLRIQIEDIEIPPDLQAQFVRYLEQQVRFGMETAIGQALNGDYEGALLSFVGAINDALTQAISSAIVDAFLNSAIGNSISGFFSGLLGGLAGAGGGAPGAQFGGFVERGQPRIVGERGPELYIPQARGDIIPNNQLGGRGGQGIEQTLNFNITGDVSRQTRRVLRQDARSIADDQTRVLRERGVTS